MKLYLAPQPSLELTRYLRSVGGDEGLAGTPMRKRSIIDAINTVNAIDELDETAQRWLAHVGTPIHALVADRTRGTSTQRLVTHVHSAPMPYGAILDLGHDLCICAPHYTFLLSAADIDLIDSVLMAMELCGTYSKWKLADAPRPLGLYQSNPETASCTFELPKVMDLKLLHSIANRQQGQRGVVGARAALRWVVEGSASPMETAIYLLLCLPKRLGGYGLPKPVLNPKLIVSNPNGTVVRFPDLFWPERSIDVEYNSDAAHSGEWSRYRDSKREVELTVADIKVLPLTRSQVMSAEDFDAFAQGLRRMLGIRSRRADPQWAYRHSVLRRRLLA
ncbi:MAG: hypothetical protein J6D34_03870 [Atopobiaceae bacterium]|nr:hypothetical protein [Atopobiaceae bacterium]